MYFNRISEFMELYLEPGCLDEIEVFCYDDDKNVFEGSYPEFEEWLEENDNEYMFVNFEINRRTSGLVINVER